MYIISMIWTLSNCVFLTQVISPHYIIQLQGASPITVYFLWQLCIFHYHLQRWGFLCEQVPNCTSAQGHEYPEFACVFPEPFRSEYPELGRSLVLQSMQIAELRTSTLILLGTPADRFSLLMTKACIAQPHVSKSGCTTITISLEQILQCVITIYLNNMLSETCMNCIFGSLRGRKEHAVFQKKI